MLFNPLDAVLGTTTKVRILRALVPLTSAVSGNEAQRLARVRSSAAMWTALDQLSDLGVLVREETRGTHLYRFNAEHDLAAPLTVLFQAESRRLTELRKELRRILEDEGVIGEVTSLILFGSNARGDSLPGSDLDFLVVTEMESSVERVRDALLAATDPIRRRFGSLISPYVLPRERVRARYQDGDPLMQAIEAEGRGLLGTPFVEVAGTW